MLTTHQSSPSKSSKKEIGAPSSPLIASLPQLESVSPSEITPNSSNFYWTSLSPVFNLFSNCADSIDDDGEDVDLMAIPLGLPPSHSDSSAEENDEDEGEEEEEVIQTLSSNAFDPIHFIAQLPPHAFVRHNIIDPTPLPPSLKNRPTLVLDLDETLVHCTNNPMGPFDLTFDIFFNDANCSVYVRKRPHLDEFLFFMSQLFEIVIFTASQRLYAQRLLDILDPSGTLISHRLFRESCLMVGGNLVKDLSILQRELGRTIIVDNCPHAFGYHLDNGIPILSWYEDPNDKELSKLQTFLHELPKLEDFRPHIRSTFGMHDLVRNYKAKTTLF